MFSPKYPNVGVQLTGSDGNAFAVMAAVGRALRNAKVPQTEIATFRQEAMSGDYDNLLRVCMSWVNVS